MMRWRIGGFALVLALAACGQSPTVAAPAEARAFGGHTYGGGLSVSAPTVRGFEAGCRGESGGGSGHGDPSPCPEPGL